MQFTKFAAAVAAVAISAGAHASTAAVGVQSATEFLLTSSNVSGGELLTASAGNATKPAGTTGAFLAAENGNNAVVTLGDVYSVSFDWGTPDSWNTLIVTESDGSTDTYTRASLGLSAADTYVNFSADAGVTITSLTFETTQPAFEASNFAVSAVPEPTNVALLLAGLGLVGTLARRRRV